VTFLKTVLRPNNPALRALAESILRDAEIPFVVEGDGAFQALYATGQVSIQVRAEDEEEARLLLADL
jgi:hypothetical protein